LAATTIDDVMNAARTLFSQEAIVIGYLMQPEPEDTTAPAAEVTQ